MSQANDAATRLIRITGTVQGVWFRESTRQQADRRGISGYAVNRRDGSVEVLSCGEPSAVAELADWLTHGPAMARVSSVTELSCSERCPAGFSTG